MFSLIFLQFLFMLCMHMRDALAMTHVWISQENLEGVSSFLLPRGSHRWKEQRLSGFPAGIFIELSSVWLLSILHMLTLLVSPTRFEQGNKKRNFTVVIHWIASKDSHLHWPLLCLASLDTEFTLVLNVPCKWGKGRCHTLVRPEDSLKHYPSGVIHFFFLSLRLTGVFRLAGQ